jgi:glycosyltransferase involved in cell wall biosynthesis
VAPTVSVISLVYKNAPLLLEAFPCLEAQTFKDFEHILFNNGSPEDASMVEAHWCRQRSFTRLVHSPENLGICRGLNAAISEAKGKYLAFLTDDRWDPDHLRLAVEALEREGDGVAAYFCSSWIANAALERTRQVDPMVQLEGLGRPDLARLFDSSRPGVSRIRGLDMLRTLLCANIIPAVAIVLRKSTFDDLGRYDSTLAFEDFEMSMRLALDHDWCFGSARTATYVEHGASYSSRFPVKVFQGAAQAVLKHYPALVERGLSRAAATTVARYSMLAAYAALEKADIPAAWGSLSSCRRVWRHLGPGSLARVGLAAARIQRRSFGGTK